MKGRINAASWLCGAFALLCLALYIIFPLTGDDYGYLGSFRTVDGFDGPWPPERFYRWFPFHWLHSNGRFANFFAMASLTFLPKWLTAVVMGAATWGMVVLALRLGDAWRGRVPAASAAVAYIALAYPWWDLMYTVDFNFNYPVATCAGLLFVYLWQRSDRISRPAGRAAAIALAFAAGGFHESMGAPLLAAFLWLAVSNRERFFADRGRSGGGAAFPLLMLGGFAAGVAVAFFSPGIWGRAVGHRVPDAPLPELLLCSAPLTLFAAVFFAALALSPRWRGWMSREARSWWGFWMVASAGALIFCAAGGIIGRGGWFSQTFALIALLLWGKAWNPSVARPLGRAFAAVMASAALFFTAAPIPRVSEMAEAEAAARGLLRESADGVVRADLPDESAQPWWTLRRVRTLDADDYYLHQVVADYYKKPRFLILPASGVDSSMVFATLPACAVPIEPGTYGAPAPERFLHTAADGSQTVYLLLPGTPRRYLATPRHRDPGDRL